MSSRSGRNLPIPPTSNSSFTALNPPSLFTSDNTLRYPSQPQNDRTMPSMNGNSPTSPYRRGHHRSISHPFTSPFSGLVKKRGKTAPKNTAWNSDSDSDEATYPDKSLATSPRKDVPKGGLGSDLAEGKCPTCNSTVRWPRHLQVYRCTSCLMVTDLDGEPSKNVKDSAAPNLEDRLQKPLPPDPPESQLSPLPLPHEPRPDAPLSINHTRRLIDGCIASYFQTLLDGPRLGVTPGDNRVGRDRPANDPPYYMVPDNDHNPGQLSTPRDPRSRSTSTSTERGQSYGTKENSNLLKPHAIPWEGKEMPIRNRANSDLQNGLKGDQRPQPTLQPKDTEEKDREKQPVVFKRLENYIIAAFKGCRALNASFPVYQPSMRSASSGNPPRMKIDPKSVPDPAFHAPVFEPDAKTLLLGDVAENSTWWMTEWAEAEGQVPPNAKEKTPHKSRSVSSRSPRINWTEANQWYQLVLTAGSSWSERWAARKPDLSPRPGTDLARYKRWESVDLSVIEKDITESRLHLQRTLMKATENLLKRPRKILKKPEDTRFLLILLANPLLSNPMAYASSTKVQSSHRDERRPSHPKDAPRSTTTTRDGKFSRKDASAPVARAGSSNHHYGLLKRILGLLSNMPNDCHHYFVSWFARYPPGQFERLVELVGGFVTYRLTRQHGRKRSENPKDGNELIPSFASASGNTPAELHAAINRRHPSKPPPKKQESPIVYAEDWQIRSAARIMSLLFTANISQAPRKPDTGPDARTRPNDSANGSRYTQDYVVPISSFYNTLLDYSDLVADFENWESRGSKFSFCQYPFFLSIWAKIHVLEHDARRQMELKAREAFFNSILNHRAVSQYLVLKVRRECLVEDSLRGVSEVVGTGQEEIKKGLRIEFVGEEGIDAGGLRKEWFLLLVREVFDPHHGLFIYDDDSKYCYFNPFCFESSEQFFLVGVLLGLAIYNSTILDIDLPPFAFRKLLASAPQNTTPQTATSQRSKFKCTLDDLAEYRPALAKGLRMLLEYEGDVAETFCYDFVAQTDRYGEIVSVPLCAGGEKRPVTNANRQEFVDAYVYYLLDTAVARQYEPFKRGFFTVCGGNALSLFRPEEIELLVRGSDEPLDVTSLRAVATYDNWSHHRPESIPVVQWFWDFFEAAPPPSQRKILSFITGSDRIPAMGATSLTIRLACLGDDSPRYPTARTCFNTLSLYRYATREKFQKLLWDAVSNSEGFGLK